jgi:branched-chain amino acid transport system permease protein
MGDFLQYFFSGLTRGSIYAIVGIGFAMIYNSSKVINFAQGEFVMIGGMAVVFLTSLYPVPLVAAILFAVVIASIVGILLQRIAIDRVRNASTVTLIIITIGASILIRGIVEIVMGKRDYTIPPFSGDANISISGATINPQSLWVIGSLLVIMFGLKLFFDKSKYGKAMLATSQNAMAAQIVGINTRFILLISFGLSAAIGAIAGIITAPITLTRFDIGVMLGLKGFCAAILGGVGSSFGAVAGGLLLGILESLASGYVSSAYQDAVAFIVILIVLTLRPEGIFAEKGAERV